MNKTIWALALVVLACGMSFAIENASVAEGTQSKWTGPTTTGSYVTEGGNVTDLNVSSNVSTEKWAGVYGNVSGTLVLTEAGVSNAYMYTWTYNPTAGGEVCASINSTPTWLGLAIGNASNVDTAWGFGTDSDNAVNTYTTQDSYVIAGQTITNTPAIDIASYSNFLSGVIALAGGTNKQSFAFCTKINSTGTNYNNQSVNFEMMLPTNEAPNTYETYYFYVELV